MSQVTLRVRRSSGSWSEFTVEVTDERETLLDALERIYAEVDSTLMYRHSCHHGSCGTCSVRVDGKEVLACVTSLASLGPGPVNVEPLAGFPVLGDLAVDPTPLFRREAEAVSGNNACLRESEGLVSAATVGAGASGSAGNPSPGADVGPGAAAREGSSAIARARPASERATPASLGSKLFSEIDRFVRLEDCIECGCCISACPVMIAGVVPFVGPQALAALRREAINRSGRREELLARSAEADGAPACERHLDCSRVCPRGVYPGKHIALLKREAAGR